MITVKSIHKVYANLILSGNKTIDKIPAKDQEAVMVALCVKKLEANKITMEAILGEGEEYTDDICFGFAKDNQERINAINGSL